MKYKSLKEFLNKEVVLTVATILAIISCFFIKPNTNYFNYIDYHTLVLLFSLMLAMAGLKKQGLFDRLGRILIGKTSSIRQVILVLVMLCFFCSMLITNDVTLITFVPFTFVVFNLLSQTARKKYLLQVVCMQTLAANLGSMFTPIGNPQNIYLYEKGGLGFFEFLKLMLPYTFVSLLLLLIWISILCRKTERITTRIIDLKEPQHSLHDTKKTFLYTVIFILSILTILHILPYQILFVVVLILTIIIDRKTILNVDYSLLLTFVAFFVFVGNLGRIQAFSDFLRGFIDKREVLTSVIASQVISNVPAALLLSGFTDNIKSLIIGTNIGGLGTLIASMASLISFRQLTTSNNENKGKYFFLFTTSNIIFLIVLIVLWFIIKT